MRTQNKSLLNVNKLRFSQRFFRYLQNSLRVYKSDTSLLGMYLLKMKLFIAVLCLFAVSVLAQDWELGMPEVYGDCPVEFCPIPETNATANCTEERAGGTGCFDIVVACDYNTSITGLQCTSCNPPTNPSACTVNNVPCPDYCTSVGKFHSDIMCKTAHSYGCSPSCILRGWSKCGCY